MRESAEAKGRRYLTEGRLMIRAVGPEGIRAIVRGAGAFYGVGYERGQWSCNCPAVGLRSHLVALQLVTVVGALP